MILPRYEILSRSHHYFLGGSVPLGKFQKYTWELLFSVKKLRFKKRWRHEKVKLNKIVNFYNKEAQIPVFKSMTSFDFNNLENGSYHFPNSLNSKHILLAWITGPAADPSFQLFLLGKLPTAAKISCFESGKGWVSWCHPLSTQGTRRRSWDT